MSRRFAAVWRGVLLDAADDPFTLAEYRGYCWKRHRPLVSVTVGKRYAIGGIELDTTERRGGVGAELSERGDAILREFFWKFAAPSGWLLAGAGSTFVHVGG